MKLIHKRNFNIIAYTTSVSRKDYLTISDELIAEIKDKFYDTGNVDENNEAVLIDLKLIDSIAELESENLFDEVESISYFDRNTKITEYENQLIDNSFRNRNYKVTTNLPQFVNFDAGTAIMVAFNDDFIKEFPTTSEEDVQICNIYLDKISESMCNVISENANLFTVETNPTRDVEVISCKIDTTINNEDGDSIPIIIED